MGLIQRVRGFFGREEPTTYECAECGTRYEAVGDEDDPRQCPSCGAGGAAAVPRM